MQDAASGQYQANALRAVFCRQWDWTFGGGQPSGPYPKNPANPTNPPQYNEVGASMLFNSTLETFQQGNDATYQQGTSCFGCHSNYPSANPNVKANTSVSHIFGAINPLP